LFFQCCLSQQLWRDLAAHFGFPYISHASFSDAFIWWSCQKASWRPIFIFSLWYIWKWRNHFIFQERKDPFNFVFDNIVSSIESIPVKTSLEHKSKQADFPTEQMPIPRAFFDRACHDDICGCGVYIIMENNLQYQIHWNGGLGSTIKAEAMALTSLLSMCHFLNIQSLQIYGDSKVIIEHVTEKHHIKNQFLDSWMNRIMILWKGMEGYSIHHIYRSQNV